MMFKSLKSKLGWIFLVIYAIFTVLIFLASSDDEWGGLIMYIPVFPWMTTSNFGGFFWHVGGIPLVLAINVFIIYFIGMAIEKLYKKFFQRRSE